MVRVDISFGNLPTWWGNFINDIDQPVPLNQPIYRMALDDASSASRFYREIKSKIEQFEGTVIDIKSDSNFSIIGLTIQFSDIGYTSFLLRYQ